MTAKVDKIRPRLSLAQQALVDTPEARREVRHVVRRVAKRFPHEDLEEVEANANEALVLAARTYEPGSTPFAAFAAKRIWGHVLRAIVRSRRATPRLDAMVQVLTAPTPALRSSAKARLAEAADTPSEARRRLLRRQSLLLVELMTAASWKQAQTPERVVALKEAKSVFVEAVSVLPDKLIGVLRLRFQGMSGHEIASQLGCSRRTVARRLEEARIHLARELQRRGVVSLPDVVDDG